MARFLFTLLVVNDHGLPTRVVAEPMRRFGGANQAADETKDFLGRAPGRP